MTTGLLHTVYFWLHADCSAQDRLDFAAAARDLVHAPTVKSCTVGSPAATPDRDVTNNDFDFMLQLHFADVADHDAYQADDVHLRFVDAEAGKFERVMVFDTRL